jgi:hypothetical protein
LVGIIEFCVKSGKPFWFITQSNAACGVNGAAGRLAG